VGSSLILVNADVNHKHGRLSIDEQRAAKSARKKARKGPCPDAQLDAVVTGQRRLKSAVAVRCALQATLTRHVRNALCASVSVLSETVSSSIMACELVSDVATSDCDITLNFTASVLFCDTVFSAFFILI